MPLSFGEFEGMIAPLALFYMVHGATVRSRVFGWAIFLTSFFGVVTSGSRGGYISFLIGLSAFVLLWAVRSVRVKGAGSLAPALIGVSVVVGLFVLFGLVMFWHRAHVMVLGGGETAASDNGRSMQWAMAIPKILMRPLTGWGAGQSGRVIGGTQASGIPSVDSYALTALVDFGIPGFVFFFGMGVIGWFSEPSAISPIRRCRESGWRRGVFARPFTFYRFYLSQWENHLPFFLLVACTDVAPACGRRAQARRKQGRTRIQGFAPTACGFGGLGSGSGPWRSAVSCAPVWRRSIVCATKTEQGRRHGYGQENPQSTISRNIFQRLPLVDRIRHLEPVPARPFR